MTARVPCAADTAAVSKLGDRMCDSGPLEGLAVRTSGRAHNRFLDDSSASNMLRGKSVH